MFRTLCKLLFLYLILTFLFSDISSLKEPSAALFRQQYADVTRTAKRVADYIDGTVIPYVDKKFDEADGNKSLVGNLVDELNDNGEQEPFSVDENNEDN